MEELITVQIAHTMEDMVAEEISVHVAESFDDTLKCAFENARTGGCSVISNVVEQVLLALVRRDVIGEALDRNISSYFNSSDAIEKVC